jgi:hypothetical protein
VQFDPATSEESSVAPVRDGLPKAFRMRHGRHYVEQLMGDAPLRTVREIAVSDFHAVPESDLDLSTLQQSIGSVGVLQPLLVTLDAGRYYVIAGRNRLRAAMALGLQTVPCLVHEVARDGLDGLRQAAKTGQLLLGCRKPDRRRPFGRTLQSSRRLRAMWDGLCHRPRRSR